MYFFLLIYQYFNTCMHFSISIIVNCSDLKPANIFLMYRQKTNDVVFKLGDLGFAHKDRESDAKPSGFLFTFFRDSFISFLHFFFFSLIYILHSFSFFDEMTLVLLCIWYA